MATGTCGHRVTLRALMATGTCGHRVTLRALMATGTCGHRVTLRALTACFGFSPAAFALVRSTNLLIFRAGLAPEHEGNEF